MHYPQFNFIAALLIALSLSACGQTKLQIKGIDLSTSQINSDTYLNMDALVLMGNLKFPNLEVPVINPVTMKPIGQMSLQSLADGSNEMMVSINYAEATKLDASLGKTLPNGREIPLALGVPSGTTLVGIPILTNSRIYVGGDLKKDLYMGAAVSISAFDSIMRQVPLPLNLFFAFPFSSQVTGVGGLFSSPTAGQNGVGIFVKKSAAVSPSATPAPVQALASVGAQMMQAPSSASLNGSEINQVNTLTLYKLNQLFNKRATLKIK